MEDLLNIFKGQRDYWNKYRLILSKSDLSLLSFKDTFSSRLKGFMTVEYYRRDKLIKEGELLISYIFKSWKDELNKNNHVPFWVIFSPSVIVNGEPSILRNVALRLNSRSFDASKGQFKRLNNILDCPYGEVSYFELPSELTDGHLIYLSIVYLPRNMANNIVLGFNPFLANKAISKEIIFLQDAYWDNSFRDAYYSRKLV